MRRRTYVAPPSPLRDHSCNGGDAPCGGVPDTEPFVLDGGGIGLPNEKLASGRGPGTGGGTIRCEYTYECVSCGLIAMSMPLLSRGLMGWCGWC